MLQSGFFLVLLACLNLACGLQAVIAQTDDCNGKPPIFIIPGVAGSELQAVYSDSNSNPVFTDRRSARASLANSVVDQTKVESQTAPVRNTTRTEEQKRLLRRVARAVAEYAKKQREEGHGADPAGWWDGDPCPNANNADRLNVWLPLEASYLLYPKCFPYLLGLKYNTAQDRFYNASNSAVAANPGGNSGTDYSIFNFAGYDELAAYIAKTFRYSIGRNLFAAPYDWRYNLNTMNQAYQMDKLAQRIETAVNKNCGKKAIIIGHSMGTLVGLGLLQNPRFEAWREANIQGYIALAPPYGGALQAVNARTSGGGLIGADDFLLTLIGPVFRELLFTGSFGLPSPVMLMPYDNAFDDDWVVVRTPRRTYTISQLDDLLADIGDQQAARFFRRVRDLKPLIAKGPVPGVPTYCIYGSAVDTAKSYSFESNLKPGVKSDPPAVTVMGKGDGTVNLESLQLCKRLTDDDNIVELSDGVDHTTVLTAASAQAALGRFLRELLRD